MSSKLGRSSRGRIEHFSRTQLERYLNAAGQDTYPGQTTREMRETALEIFEHTQPEETSHLYAYGAE